MQRQRRYMQTHTHTFYAACLPTHIYRERETHTHTHNPHFMHHLNEKLFCLDLQHAYPHTHIWSQRKTEDKTDTHTHKSLTSQPPLPTTLMHLQLLRPLTQMLYSQYALLWSGGWHPCKLHRAADLEGLGEQTVVLTSYCVRPCARHAPLTHRIPAGPQNWQWWEMLKLSSSSAVCVGLFDQSTAQLSLKR